MAKRTGMTSAPSVRTKFEYPARRRNRWTQKERKEARTRAAYVMPTLCPTCVPNSPPHFIIIMLG